MIWKHFDVITLRYLFRVVSIIEDEKKQRRTNNAMHSTFIRIRCVFNWITLCHLFKSNALSALRLFFIQWQWLTHWGLNSFCSLVRSHAARSYNMNPVWIMVLQIKHAITWNWIIWNKILTYNVLCILYLTFCDRAFESFFLFLFWSDYKHLL